MSSYNALYPPNVGAQSADHSIDVPRSMPGFPHIEVQHGKQGIKFLPVPIYYTWGFV